jgi:hypothetical protein
MGTIGARAHSSQATNAATNSTPATNALTTSALVQPAILPRSMPHTSAKAATATSAKPAISKAAAGPKLSRSCARTKAIAIMPIGRLIQKIHRHPKLSVMKPPMAGPMMRANPVTLLKMPSAHARSSLAKAPLRIAIASGITNAAPAPWADRAAINHPILPDSAQAVDATTNNPIPAANIRRRPNRSPSAAPVSSRTAKVRL